MRTKADFRIKLQYLFIYIDPFNFWFLLLSCTSTAAHPLGFSLPIRSLACLQYFASILLFCFQFFLLLQKSKRHMMSPTLVAIIGWHSESCQDCYLIAPYFTVSRDPKQLHSLILNQHVKRIVAFQDKC